MKHRFLLILFACSLFQSYANNNRVFTDSVGTGVQFESGRWQQVLKKAKKENKYIFVDCYTTWCGPCKRMEKEVYTQPEVGDYLNKHFISVKMQMDKTAADDEQTRARYPDADLIRKQQGIPGYPAYFIFSPVGQLVCRAVGYKPPLDFIGFVSGAIDPNSYKPYARYNILLSTYLKGKKDFKIIPVLLDTALQLGQQDIADSLQKDYSAYLKTLSDEQLSNRQMISYLADRVQSSDSRYFHLFHPNEEKINTLMGKNGYAQFVVGRIITNEDISPFVHLNNSGTGCIGCAVKKEMDPDWTTIEKAITEKYDSAYAKENILKAKIRWSNDHNDRGSQCKYFTLLFQKYSGNMEANGILPGNECANFMDCDLNGQCWSLFKYSVDKEQIDTAIQCMKNVLERYKHRGSGYVPEGFIDTYANLLYKAGRTDEAIQQEEEIIKYLIQAKTSARDMKPFQDTVDKMKEGKPTWPHYIAKEDFFGMGLM